MRPASFVPVVVCVVLATLLTACSGASATKTTTAPTTSTLKATPTTAPASLGPPLRFAAAHAVSPGTALSSVSCGSNTSCIALGTCRAVPTTSADWDGAVPSRPRRSHWDRGRCRCRVPARRCAWRWPPPGTRSSAGTARAGRAPTTVEGATGLGAVGCAPTGYSRVGGFGGERLRLRRPVVAGHQW